MMRRHPTQLSYAVFAGSIALGLSAPFAQNATAQSTATSSDTVVTSTTTRAPARPTTFGQGLSFPYYLLDNALTKYADKNGNVDYAGLKGDADLDLFIQALKTADMTRFPVFKVKDEKTGVVTEKRNAELVFWINAYNAHVLKTIADAYPVNNVGEIKNFDSAKTHVVAGKSWSLRELRQKVVGMDSRALFALTDGTRSGPMLAPLSYRFATVNASLEDAVNTYINDSRNIEVSRIQNKVVMNDFFQSANEVFTKKGNPKKFEGVRTLLATYTNQRTNRSYFTTSDYQIDFRPGDKSLNKKNAS
jgi:hypothetical protein